MKKTAEEWHASVERLRTTTDMHSDFLHVPMAIADVQALLALHDEAVRVLTSIRRRAKTPVQGRWVDDVFHPQLSARDRQEIRAEAEAADAFLAKVGDK